MYTITGAPYPSSLKKDILVQYLKKSIDNLLN